MLGKKKGGASAVSAASKPEGTSRATAGQQSSGTRGRHETVLDRNAWYADGARQTKRVNVALAVTAGISVVIAVGLVANEPAPRYLPMGPGCTAVAMAPLTEPYVPLAEVMDYAIQAAAGSYTFSAVNWEYDLLQPARRFIDAAWEQWKAAMKASGNLDFVESTRSTVTGAATKAPTLVDRGLNIVPGVYAWVLDVPLAVTYTSGSEQRNQSLVARITVVRRDFGADPFFKGLGVASMRVISAN